MFTMYCVLHMIVLPDILKNTYSACIAATTVGATSRKVPTGVHVFIQSTCSVWQMMHRIVYVKHVFALHKPMCFTREIRHETVCFMEIIPFELARICAPPKAPLDQSSRTPILYMLYDRGIVTGRGLSKDDDFENVGRPAAEASADLGSPSDRRHMPKSANGNSIAAA